MSIVIGCIKQESNSFCAVPAELDAFDLHVGDEVCTKLRGTKTEISGFLSVLDETGFSVVPTISATAVSGGIVTANTFRYLQDELLRRLAEAAEVEAVLLSLHGAMAAEDCDDTEGDTLLRIRKMVGPQIPIVISLDPHAHVSETMLECADAIVAYHTFPHIDAYETGQRAAKLLVDMLEGRLNPVMEYVRIPVMISPETQPDFWFPMKDIQALCRSLEGHNGIRSVNYIAVQPWLDIPGTSHMALVVADRNKAAAKEAARLVAQKVWEVREHFVPERMTPEQAVAMALQSDDPCIVLAEPYDSTAAGASGDSAALLRALAKADLTAPAFVTVIDPEAAEAAFAAGEGNRVKTAIGYQLDPRWGEPVTVEGKVVALSENGEFVLQMTGTPEYMGRTAVIQAGNLYVVVCSQSFMHLDPNSYRSLGLEPSRAKIVGVKSTIHFRAFYGPIASEIILLDAPGPSSGRFDTFDWKRLSRPVWPLDEIDWNPEDGIIFKK